MDSSLPAGSDAAGALRTGRANAQPSTTPGRPLELKHAAQRPPGGAAGRLLCRPRSWRLAMAL